MKKFYVAVLALVILALAILPCFMTGCDMPEDTGSKADVTTTIKNANELQTNQPTPTDIEYSLERYNLIRRAYWVNGMRERASTLPCEIEKPLGYIVLFTDSGAVVGSFIVDGKVSSLNSFLTPDSEYYEKNLGSSSGGKDSSNVDRYSNKWLADVDGSYGTNDNGIFFFTPDGRYIEYTGTYLYSDIPFIVENPVLKVEGGKS